MTVSQVSYTMDSTLETVNNAEALATRIATEAGFEEGEVMQISLAVREAVINAVMHGNGHDPAKKVTFGFERTGEGLVISVRDEGPGMDPATLPDPLAPENLMRTSGRGIFLIRTMMDDVQIRTLHPGTEIKLMKRVPSPAGGTKEATQ